MLINAYNTKLRMLGTIVGPTARYEILLTRGVGCWVGNGTQWGDISGVPASIEWLGYRLNLKSLRSYVEGGER